MPRTGRQVAVLAAWIALASGVLYLVLLGGGGLAMQLAELRLLNILLLSGSLAIWLIVAIRRPDWRPRTVAWPAIVAILLAFVGTTVTAVHPRISWDFVAYATLLAAGYLFLERLFANPFFAPRLGNLCLVLGFLVASWYLVLVAGHWSAFWTLIGRFTMPPLRPAFEGLSYGTPNAVGSVVLLLWLASAAHLGFGTARRRLVLGILGGLVLVVVFITAARASWVGSIAAAALVGLLRLARPAQRVDIQRWLARRATRVLVGMVAVGAAIVAVLFLPAIASRFAEPGTDARLVFYVAALRMFQASPLVGVGPGNWAVERIRFTQAGETDYYIPHAHNLELQVVAEFGAVGIVAAFVIVLVFLGSVRRGLGSADPLTRRLAWAALAAGAYLIVYQQFDSYAGSIAVLFPFAAVLAWLDARLDAERPADHSRTRWVTAGVAITLLGATGWLVWVEAAGLVADDSILAIRQGRWDAALSSARAAAGRDPDEPPYQFALGLTEAHAGDPAAARQAMARAAAADDFPIAWLNLARLDVAQNRTAEAVADLAAALRLGRQQPQVTVAAAVLHLELGLRDEATDDLTSALLVAPSLASDPAVTEAFGAVREVAVGQALKNADPSTELLLDLELGRFDDARAGLGAVPPADRDRASSMVDAWAGDLAAFRRIRSNAQANPLDQTLAGTCRRLELLATSEERGADWSCGGIARPPIFLVVRVVPAFPDRPVLPGPDASWHFEYVYRRADPLNLLVPGLPHLQSTW